MQNNNIQTDDFDITYSADLQDFIDEVVQISKQRKEVLCKIFNCKMNDIPTLKVAAFSQHKDFVDYIYNISNQRPPKWATGCFFNNGIQILVNKDNIRHYNASKYTISHEMTHLFINKFVYKDNIPRLKWWDECYAYWLERPLTQERIDQAYRLTRENEYRKDFDMNTIKNDSSNENEVDAFPLYKIIGYYIFTNNKGLEYIQTIKDNRDKMVNIGKHILSDAINYINAEQNAQKPSI